MTATRPLVVAANEPTVEAIAAALVAEGVQAEVVGFLPSDEVGRAAALGRAEVVATFQLKKDWLVPGAPVRLVHVTGAGTNAIDLEALPAGVTVCNVYGHEYAIAEHVFMVMAALNRELLSADARLRRGEWGGPAPLRELRGRRLLICGLGHIGREVARWGAFLGMRMSGVTRRPAAVEAQALGLERVGGLDALGELASATDFLVCALPLTDETRGLIGRDVLDRLPTTAYVVNVARGPLIDESALYEALLDRRIAGAAIDVWYQYPEEEGATRMPSREPFGELDNVILTPHQSGFTEGTMRFRWAFIARNLRRYVEGEPLENVVWPPRPA